MVVAEASGTHIRGTVQPVGWGVEEADDGPRTRNPQLGRLILYQLSYIRSNEIKWGEQDSNLRSHTATDLQSAPFVHLGISPKNHRLVIGIEPTTY